MTIILDILNLITYIPHYLNPDQSQISTNIEKLKKLRWYQQLYEVEKFKNLIIGDEDVRKTIGRFNSKKLNQKNYQFKAQRKLERVLGNKVRLELL